MFRTIGILFGLAVGLIATASDAAQPRTCANRGDALAHLLKKYSEAPVAMGLASNGGVLEVLSSKTGTSWTIIVTMPNGVSCMLATGVDWESLKKTTMGSKVSLTLPY